jgi:hypothetical protein
MGRSMPETVYVQNKSLHRTLKNINPEEAFSRVKPKIENFRIFECLVYFQVPKEKNSNLDTSGRKDTFMDNNESSKTFQIYIPGQRQIQTSRDVVLELEISLQRTRESHMEIDSETIPSLPSTVQRETNIIPTDPISPVDMSIDIAVGHKTPT